MFIFYLSCDNDDINLIVVNYSQLNITMNIHVFLVQFFLILFCALANELHTYVGLCDNARIGKH